jgi:AcrR family transcriptional regulator
MARPARQTASGGTRKRYAPRMAPAQRREQLLDAALQVVLEQGYAGVSIEAIARQAGVTRPVIYDHFANLGELIQTLIEREERYALTQLAAVLVGPDGTHHEGDLATLLRIGLPHFFESVAERPATWRIILRPLEGTPPIVREYVETNRAMVLARIQDIVARAESAGELTAKLDVEVTARAIMGLAWDAGGMILTDPAHHTPDRYVAFVRILADQLLARK